MVFRHFPYLSENIFYCHNLYTCCSEYSCIPHNMVQVSVFLSEEKWDLRSVFAVATQTKTVAFFLCSPTILGCLQIPPSGKVRCNVNSAGALNGFLI